MAKVFPTFLLLQLFLASTALSLECGEFYSVHHNHLHSSADEHQEVQNSNILETRIVNGELASLGEFPWQISMQRRVRPKVAAGQPPAVLPGIASAKPETPKPPAANSSTTPPPLPAQPPLPPQNPVDKVQNTSASASNEVILTEEEILDESLWGRFLWPLLAREHQNVTFEQQQAPIVNWPPPLPTHAPGSQTFPPLPTHSPGGQRLPAIPTHTPGSQTFPPMPPMPTFPPGVGGVPHRPWSPPPPSNPGQQWPPPLPSHPPRLPPQPSSFPPLITSPSTPFPPFPPASSTTFRPPIPSQPPRLPKPSPPRPPIIDPSQKWQHFCGGSIIDPSWILTAAHCVEALKHTYTPGLIRVVAGSLDWRNVDPGRSQIIPVDRIVVHPGWSQASGQNDVALLHLATPLEFTQDSSRLVTVNKVCLSRAGEGEHTGMATSSGWGFLHKDQRVSPDLMRRVDIPVVDHASCRSAFSRVIGVTQMQVCAGQAPKGNCMGDSGGPLVQKTSRGGGGSGSGTTGRATQIGIVSFSIPCAVPGFPDVFTRVAKYLDWISQNSGIPF